MNCLLNKSTDPYFNIAAEEFFLKEKKEDILIIWRSKPSVIVGKHQNSLAEINYRYLKEKNIPVIRRISGGGTVYHDLGNINFTFIQNSQPGNLVDFKKFTSPVLEYLGSLNIPARFEGKNDLRVHGKKISGNAEHVHKTRVLHHGTLLYSADMIYLSKALDITKGKFKDKAVQSVRSKTTNIIDFLDEKKDAFAFMLGLYNFFASKNKKYDLSKRDINSIKKLSLEKYQSWEWNFGYSPSYSFSNDIVKNNTILKAKIHVEKGIIKKALLSGDQEVEYLSNYLTGIYHREKDIACKLSVNNVCRQKINTIVDLLFV